MSQVLLRRAAGGNFTPPVAPFPAVRNSQAVATTGAQASLTINYTASSGDLVIINFNSRSSAASAPTLSDSGWALFGGTGNANGSNVASWVYTKVVTGSGSLTITPASSLNCAAYCFVVETGTHQNVIEVANSTGTGSPNPASLTPSWGAANTLWIAGYGQAFGSTVSVYPLPDNNLSARSGTVSASCSVGVCTQKLNSATLDPGTFTVSTTAAYYGRHIAVRPAF